MIYCLLGKSASGKDTIIKKVSEDMNIPIVTSHTTRPMRPNEKQDREYHFVNDEFFNKHKDEFLEIREYKVYTGETWYYGFHKNEFTNGEKMLIIDANGRNELIKYFGKDNIMTFYIHSYEEVRRERLKNRGDNKLEIERRIKTDDKDFKEFLDRDKDFYWIDNNGTLNYALTHLESIIRINRKERGII